MPDAFEIGLVLAGAVSAGAYTAGVIDFIYEALDAYYAARVQPDWNGPRHDVRIPIMTGASAGGMTSAIAALHAFRDLESVRPLPAIEPVPERNRLYQSWVKAISFDELLKLDDLQGPGKTNGVQSALCCQVLDDIVDNAFDIAGAPRTRAWIGRQNDPTLRLRLTLTNLRGVPYGFPVFGSNSTDSFGMLNHADFAEFVVGAGDALRAAASDGATPLDVTNFAGPGWSALKGAALATGAFPVGLRPRIITRGNTNFYRLNGRVGYEGGPGEPPFVHVDPDGDFVASPYAFVAVDGGTIDNEPLELARRYLAGSALHNDPNGIAAKKAVLLIAPFPSYAATPPANLNLDLAHVLPALASALKEQARFKPDELRKASDDRYYSRFLVSPIRKGNHTAESETYPIACGALGGFSGFLDESFRRHDYLLGRRNAQAFLRWNFALPRDNSLFAGAQIDAKWFVRNADGQTETLNAGADDALPLKNFAATVDGGHPQPGFPIVPLTVAMREPIEISALDMPDPASVDRDLIRGLVAARARKVLSNLIEEDIVTLLPALAGLVQFPLREGASIFGAHFVTEFAMKQIGKALDDLETAFTPN
jgi:Patatin-like phospholipase